MKRLRYHVQILNGLRTVYGQDSDNEDQLVSTRDLQWMDCDGLAFYEHWQNGDFIGNLILGAPTEHSLCMNNTVRNDGGAQSSVCQDDGPLVHKDTLFGVVSYNYSACDNLECC